MTTKGEAYQFRENLFVTNPFEEIELDGVEVDIQGWGANHGLFEQVIKHLEPLTIIELGTWKGASAIHMANLCKKYDLPSQILCVDNWIGFPSYYFRKEQAHAEFKIKGGFPRLYWTFMKNVQSEGLEDMITPLVQQTAQAAQICRAKNIRPDLIYIDGDHSYEGCKSDLDLFQPILAPNGVILCDDYQWEGAKKAIDEHHEETGCQKYVVGNKVLFSYGRDISAVTEVMDENMRKREMFERRKQQLSED